MMRILLSNDDGVNAPGLIALHKYISQLEGVEVYVMAPDSDRSGSSSALTITRPLHVTQIDDTIWSVNGTPADCVYLACHGFFEFTFDLVVAGINSGANLGDDVAYSGTVGAAMEGRLMRLPSIAVSLAGGDKSQYTTPEVYTVAASWIADWIKAGIPELPERHIYNVNIPCQDTLKGVRVTHMGEREKANPVIHGSDPRQRPIYWIGLAGKGKSSDSSAEHLSDFTAVSQGYVSITPIQIDATNYQLIEQLQHKLNVNQQS